VENFVKAARALGPVPEDEKVTGPVGTTASSDLDAAARVEIEDDDDEDDHEGSAPQGSLETSAVGSLGVAEAEEGVDIGEASVAAGAVAPRLLCALRPSFKSWRRF